MKAARPYIFGLRVYVLGNKAHFVQGILGKFKLYAFSFQKSCVLLDKGVLWLHEDFLEIFLVKGFKLNPQREASLKLRNQITWGRNTESSGSNKENMSCINNAKLCIYVTSFYNRKNITLNTFAAYILTVAFSMNGNLINFINKDNSTLFNAALSLVCNLVVVNHVVKSFFCKDFAGFADCNRALFPPAGTVHHIDDALHAVLKVVD